MPKKYAFIDYGGQVMSIETRCSCMFPVSYTHLDVYKRQVIDMLMQRYGIADGDVQKLMSALESDNAYWNAAAEEAGMDVEQWGNVCLIVRDLLGGATVDECMAKLDALQDAAA